MGRIASGTDTLSQEAQRNATVMFFSLVRCLLASKRVLSEHKLSRLQFEWLLGEVKTRFVGVSHALQSRDAGLSLVDKLKSYCCLIEPCRSALCVDW